MSNTVCMFCWLKIRGGSSAGQQQSVRQLHAEQVRWAWKAQHLRQLCAGYKMQLLHNWLSGRGKEKKGKKTQKQLKRYLQSHAYQLDNTHHQGKDLHPIPQKSPRCAGQALLFRNSSHYQLKKAVALSAPAAALPNL